MELENVDLEHVDLELMNMLYVLLKIYTFCLLFFFYIFFFIVCSGSGSLSRGRIVGGRGRLTEVKVEEVEGVKEEV